MWNYWIKESQSRVQYHICIYNRKYFSNIHIYIFIYIFLTTFMMITCMGLHWSSTLLGCMKIDVDLDGCICSLCVRNKWYYMLCPSIWRSNFLLIQSAFVHISIPGACLTAKVSMDMQHCNGLHAPIHIYIYHSAFNVGRPLSKAVTPWNVANDLLHYLMVKSCNWLSLMWVGTCAEYVEWF